MGGRRYGVAAGELRVKPRHMHPYLLCNRTLGKVPAALSVRIARTFVAAKVSSTARAARAPDVRVRGAHPDVCVKGGRRLPGGDKSAAGGG